MEKLKIMLEDDRLAVAAILVKNGYIVRQSKERVEGKRSYASNTKSRKERRNRDESDDTKTAGAQAPSGERQHYVVGGDYEIPCHEAVGHYLFSA